MKKFTFFTFFVLISICANAQQSNDSLAYQLQRAKINSMLAQRTQKFGQYSESLAMHTGIFGLQTKKDIRRSNDILIDIIKTDDDIYKQLKILLEFRAFQQNQVQSHSSEVEESRIGYMITINKLRKQVEQFKTASQKQEEDEEKTIRAFIIALAAMLVLLLFLLTRPRNVKV
ncbi:hypothetical protein [Mucilaginibacter sp.]|uniref:hypothetical protein n=1 Tax=Mucilaginibacter sp. TaxID=1882438 RepID=UPI00283C18F1|nr:hypothetical protein [Mucilaginibacter sp.]MDR3694878.1 hypothetical protein [Mucilaginibacter sp.]